MANKIIFLVLLCISCILSLAKTADDIKKISKFSLVILLYTVAVISIQTPLYYKENNPEYLNFKYDLFKWVKGFGCFIYSYNCIVNVFLVKTSLNNSSKPRLKKIFDRTVCFLLVFYLLIGLCGYVSFGQRVSEFTLILERPPLNDSNDVFMKVAICMIAVVTFIGFITHVIPIKQQIVGFFKVPFTQRWNLVLSQLITFSSISIAYFYPNCQEIFSISGSFFGTTIICTIPGIMICTYLWRTKQQFRPKSFLFHGWLLIFSCLGYFSGITLMYKLIDSKK